MQEISKANEAPNAMPRSRVTVRKIGKTTFIVSSRFSEKKGRDPAAARHEQAAPLRTLSEKSRH